MSADRGSAATAPSRWRTAGRWWKHVAAGLAVAWSLAPVGGLVAISLSRGGVWAGALPCGDCVVENLSGLFSDPARPYLAWYLNSLLSAAVAAGLVVLLGVAAAYGLSHLRFRSRRMAWEALLLLRGFPAVLAVLGIYLTVNTVGEAIPKVGRNTWLGLALCYVGVSLAWVVWLVTRQLDAFPPEVADAAALDGAGHVRIFAMTMQQVGGALWTIFGLVFVSVYGEFMLASVLLSDSAQQTLAVGLTELALGQGSEGAQLQGRFAAGALLASLPAVLTAFACLRRVGGPALLGPVR